MKPKLRLASDTTAALAAGLLVGLLGGCMEPAPKLTVLPPSGLALRVYVFGAEAEEGRAMFDSVRDSNPKVTFVREGGDAEIVMGLDHDNKRCVEPTGYCEYRVALRIRDASGAVLHSEMTTVGASSETCSSLCSKALQKSAVGAVEKAAALLRRRDEVDAGPPRAEASVSARPARSRARRPAICGVGSGPRLPSEEAERRIAQVDALQRQNVLGSDEFECLRKAYLSRL